MRTLFCGIAVLLAVVITPGYAQTDTTITASGLKYVLVQRGQGAYPVKGAKVAVNFTGKFKDGRIFDASSLEGKPIKVRLGRGEVIPAWEQILPLMQVGTKLVLVVPAKLAYGREGLQSDGDEYKVPPDTDLIFEMELVAIKS